MDTTQALTKVDHLSQVFRYIICKNENDAIAVDINERFLGFENISDNYGTVSSNVQRPRI